MSYQPTEEGRRGWAASSRLSFGERWDALSIMGRVNYVFLRLVAVAIVLLAAYALRVAPPPALSSALYTSLAFPVYCHVLHAAFVRRACRARAPRPASAVTFDVFGLVAAVALGAFVVLRSYFLLWPSAAPGPDILGVSPSPLVHSVRWAVVVSKYVSAALFGLGLLALARGLHRVADESGELPPPSGLFTFGAFGVVASCFFLLASGLDRLATTGCM